MWGESATHPPLLMNLVTPTAWSPPPPGYAYPPPLQSLVSVLCYGESHVQEATAAVLQNLNLSCVEGSEGPLCNAGRPGGGAGEGRQAGGGGGSLPEGGTHF